jgi:hypothetical protein
VVGGSSWGWVSAASGPSATVRSGNASCSPSSSSLELLFELLLSSCAFIGAGERRERTFSINATHFHLCCPSSVGVMGLGDGV